MAYDFSIRKGLNGNGIDNSRIGFDGATKTVTVDNKPFMKADFAPSGTSFTDESKFKQAWNNFGRPANMQTSSTPTTTTPTAATPTVSTPATSTTPDYHQMISDIYTRINNPQSYDVYSDPAYIAALANTNNQTHQAARRTQEAFGQSGFARSTNLGDRLMQDEQKANNYLQTQVVPSIIQTHNQQQQQELANRVSLINTLLNANNQEFNQGVKTGELTGKYYDPQKEALYQQMQNNSAKWATASPAEQQRLHQENINIAHQLGISYDPATGTYTQPNFYTPTVQAQELQHNIQQDAIKNGFTQQQIEQAAKQFAENNKLDWAKLSQDEKQFMADMAIKQGQLRINQQNADTSAKNAKTSAASQQTSADRLAFEKGQAKSPKPTKNDIEAEYISNIDKMPQEKLPQFFKEQKANIIKDLGLSGYNTLKQQYGIVD